MNKLSFCILLTILIIFTSQQNTPTTTVKPQTTNTPIVTSVLTPAEKSYDVMLRRMEEETAEQFVKKAVNKQIIIWTSIALAFVLYFSVMSLIDMHNPKSSILYAKYGTTRGGNEY